MDYDLIVVKTLERVYKNYYYIIRGEKMKFEKVFNNKKYIRKIEGMGEGLVLFEISVVDKRIGQNYHLFYEDKRKPPLDIAINPENGMIEYISYFVQDEIINNISNTPVIIDEGMGISIYNQDFDENNMCKIRE